ncbi:hypothetical protein FNE39_04595 [Helicobacter pylori]|nr:hypothetical protein FNE39_04595 [Helicobacter pylori]
MFLKFCFSSASQNFRSPILGVNAKIGYQNYFNDFIGLAYYGIIKYNYAKAINQKVQQLSSAKFWLNDSKVCASFMLWAIRVGG